jgi:predicted O-methyltransferase YrrM
MKRVMRRRRPRIDTVLPKSTSDYLNTLGPTDGAIQRKWSFRNCKRNLPFYTRRESSRNGLAELFGALGFNEGLEVGTYLGEFADLLCTCNPKLHLTCVDPWMAYMGRTQEREDGFFARAMRRLKGKNITIIRKPSQVGVLDIKDRSLDFVYIDGDHQFDHAMMDIIKWAPKVKSGGIIAVHDYDISEGADVSSAVNAYTHAHHIDPWYVTRELTPTAYWVQR